MESSTLQPLLWKLSFSICNKTRADKGRDQINQPSIFSFHFNTITMIFIGQFSTPHVAVILLCCLSSTLISLLHLSCYCFSFIPSMFFFFLADCDIFSLNFLTGIRTGCGGHFLLLYNSMTLNCPKNPGHLSKKVQVVGVLLPAVSLVNKNELSNSSNNVLRTMKNEFWKPCIVFFSVTNKTVNVKEEFP